jgi:hypothetical protein
MKRLFSEVQGENLAAWTGMGIEAVEVTTGDQIWDILKIKLVKFADSSNVGKREEPRRLPHFG